MTGVMKIEIVESAEDLRDLMNKQDMADSALVWYSFQSERLIP